MWIILYWNGHLQQQQLRNLTLWQCKGLGHKSYFLRPRLLLQCRNIFTRSLWKFFQRNSWALCHLGREVHFTCKYAYWRDKCVWKPQFDNLEPVGVSVHLQIKGKNGLMNQIKSSIILPQYGWHPCVHPPSTGAYLLIIAARLALQWKILLLLANISCSSSWSFIEPLFRVPSAFHRLSHVD